MMVSLSMLSVHFCSNHFFELFTSSLRSHTPPHGILIESLCLLLLLALHQTSSLSPSQTSYYNRASWWPFKHHPLMILLITSTASAFLSFSISAPSVHSVSTQNPALMARNAHSNDFVTYASPLPITACDTHRISGSLQVPLQYWKLRWSSRCCAHVRPISHR
jgi:hypothetical protein